MIYFALIYKDVFEFCALWKKLLSRKQTKIAFLVNQEVSLEYAVNRFSNATVSKTIIQIFLEKKLWKVEF